MSVTAVLRDADGTEREVIVAGNWWSFLARELPPSSISLEGTDYTFTSLRLLDGRYLFVAKGAQVHLSDIVSDGTTADRFQVATIEPEGESLWDR